MEVAANHPKLTGRGLSLAPQKPATKVGGNFRLSRSLRVHVDHRTLAKRNSKEPGTPQWVYDNVVRCGG
jgi:hypothetical protein